MAVHRPGVHTVGDLPSLFRNSLEAEARTHYQTDRAEMGPLTRHGKLEPLAWTPRSPAVEQAQEPPTPRPRTFFKRAGRRNVQATEEDKVASAPPAPRARSQRRPLGRIRAHRHASKERASTPTEDAYDGDEEEPARRPHVRGSSVALPRLAWRESRPGRARSTSTRPFRTSSTMPPHIVRDMVSTTSCDSPDVLKVECV